MKFSVPENREHIDEPVGLVQVEMSPEELDVLEYCVDTAYIYDDRARTERGVLRRAIAARGAVGAVWPVTKKGHGTEEDAVSLTAYWSGRQLQAVGTAITIATVLQRMTNARARADSPDAVPVPENPAWAELRAQLDAAELASENTPFKAAEMLGAISAAHELPTSVDLE